MEIYTPLVHQLARKRGLQDADAEDLTQDVFRPSPGRSSAGTRTRPPGSFRAWLFRIARNLLVDLLAARRRHPRGSGDAGVGQLLEQQAAPAAEDPAHFEAEYRGRLFAWAAGQVRGEFRAATWQAFWLAGVEGRPAAEVAERLGVSVGVVYNNKSRVMARLRQRIEQVQGES